MRFQDIYQAHYTKSSSIVHYMTNMLSVQPGMRIMEPSAGDGIFIDSLVDSAPNLQMDVYDLNPTAINILREKFSDRANVRIKLSDTITDDELTLFARTGGIYDGIIGNPPYGAWQDYEKRKDLKKLYPDIYVKETYALFLFRCVSLLAEGGKLVFIVPDTFLNLHMHTGLRRYLLTNTKIREIALFPSSFFPDVNFGYSNLAIITLEKACDRDTCLNNAFAILSGFKRVEELETLVTQVHKDVFVQKDVCEHPDYAFFSTENAASKLINSCQLRIGDLADCVTGMYSGNDTKHLRPISSEIRNSRKYSLLDKTLIFTPLAPAPDILYGIDSPRCFIPIVKGGAFKYLKPDL
jgi:adenine-specific DNA-methyltransferase